MNYADTVYLRLLEQDNRLDDQCRQVALENERRRNAQQRAEGTVANTQATASPLNQAYETAKQTYSDAKRVGNLMINPRDEVGRIVGEKLAEFGQQGSELALRGTPGPQHPEYDARHDRVKDVNDAITQNEGVKAIQDSTLDELKRRNNKTLTALDDFDREVGEIAAATSKSAQQSSRTDSLHIRSSDTSSEQMSSNTWHYIDPRTGFRFDIPRGHVLYRDLITRSLSVVELSTINSFGDALDGGTCTSDGLGIVSPICEARRGI